MNNSSNTDEAKTDVISSRVDKWIHEAIHALAKVQDVSASSKAAEYIEEGLRKELAGLDFEKMAADEEARRSQREKDLQGLISTQEIVVAKAEERRAKQVGVNN